MLTIKTKLCNCCKNIKYVTEFNYDYFTKKYNKNCKNCEIIKKKDSK